MGVDDAGARVTYDLLRLKEPQIEEEGLWTDGKQYAIIVPAGPLTPASNGHPIVKWVQAQRLIGVALEVLAAPPPGWVQVPDRDLDAIVAGGSAARNLRELNVDLSLALPRSFPDFVVERSSAGARFDVLVPRPLTAEEEQQFKAAYETMELPIGFTVEVVLESELAGKAFRYPPGLPGGDIELIISRRLPPSTPRAVRLRCEEDEDFWITNRRAIGRAEVTEPKDVLKKSWVKRKSRCFVDAAVFPPDDIRNYLSIYDEVVVAAPLGEKLEENCAALGIDKREMPELVATGRVRLVLPQSVDRYDVNWLSSVIEAAPDQVLLSRRLAAATVLFSRSRVPVLYPALTVVECKQVLSFLRQLGQMQPKHADAFKTIGNELSDKWAAGPDRLNDLGAMATGHLGIASIISALVERTTGKNLLLEFTSSASSVEWAGALGATVIPKMLGEQSDQAVCELMASLYSGVEPSASVPVVKELSPIIDGILSISRRDVPVVEFANAFGGGDIERFREVVNRIARENVDPEELRVALTAFNKAVKQYERRPDTLKNWNLVGLLGIFGAAAATGDHRAYIAFGAWLIGAAVNQMKYDRVGKNQMLGRIVDQLSGEMKKGAPEIVLVARMRRQLKERSG